MIDGVVQSVFGIAGIVREALTPGAIDYAPQRSIAWPSTDANGNPVYGPDGQPSWQGILYYVTQEEEHHDELIVTDQPIEMGTVISDHAFKLPPELVLRLWWTNAMGGQSGFVQQVYAALLNAQAQRLLVSIETGKRSYDSMILHRLSTRTTAETEYALVMDIRAKQILLAQTETVAVPAAANMKSPAVNGATTMMGTRSLGPAPAYNAADALAKGIAPP